MLSLSSLHKACCVDSMEVVAEDEFLMTRRLCLHGGVGAILLAWVGQARHFGRKAFAERLVLLFACALRSPHQVRENPAGQTPSDLGGVRVIRAQQSAPVDHQGKSEGSSFQLAACCRCLHCTRRAVWTAWKGVAEDEFLMTRRLCLHGGVGAILLAWVGQARHFGRKAFAERLVLLFACALRSPHQVRENPAGQTPSDLGGVRVIHAPQSAPVDSGKE